MDACTTCGRRSATARIESAHSTSEGVVRYLRCECGRRWIELARLVLDGQATGRAATSR